MPGDRSLCSRFRRPLQVDGSEGWKGEDEGVWTALGGLVGGVLTAGVANVRAAVVGSVGVHDFPIIT
jgi:hypothetical protein